MSAELEKAGLDRFQKIKTICNFHPSTCKDSASIKHVIETVSKTGHRRIPLVSRRKKFVGMITVMDVLDAYLRGHDFEQKATTIMSRDVVFCSEDDAIGFVLQKFKISRKGTLPVLHKSKLVGLITEREIIRPFSKVFFNTKISDVMTKKPFVIKPQISILDTLKAFVNTRYRRFPITDNKKLVGFVSAIDILNFLGKNNSPTHLSKPVESIMIENTHTIKKTEDVSNAIMLFEKHDIGALPVIDDSDNLEGLITERNVLEEIV